MLRKCVVVMAAIVLAAAGNSIPRPAAAQDPANKTVFLIVMENKDWAQIEGSESAPYINETLLPMASYALEYYNPPGLHPSLRNYLWLEAGTDFGVMNNKGPQSNHQDTGQHLVSLLEKAGISWKSYQEDISGTECPIHSEGLYAPKHNPMIYFDDVTGGNDPDSAYCIEHVRPYTELATDLENNTVARYNYITPNLCNDMHNKSDCASRDAVNNGDTWLSTQIPMILDSQAYADGGVLIITWDEGYHDNDGPIGLILLSPNAKGNGYTSTIHYTHSSTLRTLQELFGVTPLLGDAANATNLSDLFAHYP